MKSGKRGSVELSFLSMKMWRLQYRNTWLWFVKHTRTAAILANMAKQRILRHAGGTRERVHIQQTNAVSWHLNWRHLRPELHLHHLVTMGDPKLPQSKARHPDMCIYILLFPNLNFAILMQRPRMASTIKIIIMICWPMKEHPLVSTLSAVC